MTETDEQVYSNEFESKEPKEETPESSAKENVKYFSELQKDQTPPKAEKSKKDFFKANKILKDESESDEIVDEYEF